MTNNAQEIHELLGKFKHKTENYVKFHEVDSFQVVHNLNYLLWLEIARVEYCKELGISILPDKNNSLSEAENEIPFSIYLVRNEINYFNPATFFDNYIIYTRVSKLGFSSVTFEHIITKKDGTPLCINQAVEVYVSQDAMRPIEIVSSIRKKIIDFEKDDLEISVKQ
jgi:YbgC/YbaW family acyl-CoA thioester hydrolase